MPMTPLTGDIGTSDLAVLERWADPNALLRAGKARLTAVIAEASHGQQGTGRAEEWLRAARAAVDLYGGDSAVAFADLARPGRFARGEQFKSFTGLVARASETGESDRKGQPMSKAGPSLLRTTLQRAADHARAQDPQLARIYFLQMVERGANHTKALCVVAAHLAERAWAVMARGTPYVVRDTDGRPVAKAEAGAIIAEQWTVPEDVRRRRRHKKVGKVPHQVLVGHVSRARSAVPRRPSPPASSVPEAVASTTQEGGA